MKIEVDGVEYASTADALLAARQIVDAVRRAKVAAQPSFTLMTESTHYLWCTWCEKYVDTLRNTGDQQQAEWEHMERVHPGTAHI